jgi:hypothetical protein
MSIYTNQQKIEAVLQRELTEEEEEIVSDAINAVGKAINAYTGRIWLDLDEETADEETRYFDGNGKRELFIDDFMSISRIRFLDSLGGVTNTLPTTSYTYYPLNSDWKNSIFLRDRRFPRVRSGVEVTGVFYTGEVPVDIQLTASTLVGHFFASSRNVGDFKKESIEGYSYEILTGEEKTSQDKATFDKIDYWRKVNL